MSKLASHGPYKFSENRAGIEGPDAHLMKSRGILNYSRYDAYIADLNTAFAAGLIASRAALAPGGAAKEER